MCTEPLISIIFVLGCLISCGRPVSLFVRPVRRDCVQNQICIHWANYVLAHLRKHTSFTLISHKKPETISPISLKQGFSQHGRAGGRGSLHQNSQRYCFAFSAIRLFRDQKKSKSTAKIGDDYYSEIFNGRIYTRKI